MKVSIIIPLYKDLVSLNLVLQAIQRQTYDKDKIEVIITEDDDAKETIEFLKDWKNKLNIIHLSQPDTGRNKVIAQNKAIAKATGKYLFFIDGDIVIFKHFIEYSLKIAKPKRILAGRRVNLDENTTKLIKEDKLDITDIENNYFSFFWKNKNNRETRAEQGIQLNPNSLLYKLISKRKRNGEILGCNFSCFKDDMIAINGFDEGYHPIIIFKDDTDLTWRFKGIGCELYSSKNIANCFHLWHKENTLRDLNQDKIDLLVMQQKQKQKLYYCVKGVANHDL